MKKFSETELQKMITKGSWSTPDNYIGPSHNETFSIGVAQTRDSDLLEVSNFEAALEMLGGESKHVEVIRDGHWGCGWVEHIRVSKKAPNKIIQKSADIIKSLKAYPVLDEDNYYSKQNEAVQSHAQDCAHEAAKCLRKLTDLPDDLIEEIAENFAFEVIYETNAYCGEIYFDETRAEKIASGKDRPCASDNLNDLKTLNGF